jgi:hypothetical protein
MVAARCGRRGEARQLDDFTSLPTLPPFEAVDLDVGRLFPPEPPPGA